MFHRKAFHGFVLSTALLLVGCDPLITDDGADLGQLDPEGIDLPSEYARYDKSTGSLEITPTEWSLLASNEPSESSCGSEVLWGWGAEPIQDGFGDPTVRLYVCEAPDSAAADRFLDSTAIEDSVVPQNDTYEPVVVELQTPLANSDYSRVACVWGEPSECRAWAFVGKYGKHIVSAHWIAIAIGGALDQTAFADLVTSIDESMAAAN